MFQKPFRIWWNEIKDVILSLSLDRSSNFRNIKETFSFIFFFFLIDRIYMMCLMFFFLLLKGFAFPISIQTSYLSRQCDHGSLAIPKLFHSTSLILHSHLCDFVHHCLYILICIYPDHMWFMSYHENCYVVNIFSF